MTTRVVGTHGVSQNDRVRPVQGSRIDHAGSNEAVRPAPSVVAHVPDRCQATTRDGNACRMRTGLVRGLCRFHR